MDFVGCILGRVAQGLKFLGEFEAGWIVGFISKFFDGALK